jgi:hypothetical protein
MALLASEVPLFPYQEANYWMVLRYTRTIPPRALGLAWRRLRARKAHPYVRVQAALLVGSRPLNAKSLASLRTVFDRDPDTQVKRALAVGLCQLSKADLDDFVRTMVFSPRPPIQRVGRAFDRLMADEQTGLRSIRSMFGDFTDNSFIDRLFELELLYHSRCQRVRHRLLVSLVDAKPRLGHPVILNRVRAMQSEARLTT